MTLAAYQDALASLVASPELVSELRAGDVSALAAYDLTDRERGRLLAVVAQPGMAVNCTLYRSHRMVPLASLLPGTCDAIGGARLRELVDAFWAATPDTMIQFEAEARAFAAYVSERVPEVAALAAAESAALADRYPTADERNVF